MSRFKAVSAVMLAAALALGGCKFIKTEDEQKAAAAGAFNPDKLVADIWDSKVLPYLNERAGAFQDVSALAARSSTVRSDHAACPVRTDRAAARTSAPLPA